MTPTALAHTTDTANLTNWLTDLRTQGHRLTATNNTVRITGRTHIEHDSHIIATHRHTLTTIAPDPRWARWWQHICGRQPDQTLLALADIPTHPDTDAFVCTTCGIPAGILDRHLIAWCPDHDPPHNKEPA